MRTINSINAKGGCGKSTIAMNLAAGLALRGFRTLLIDMDPQAQVTQWLGAGDGLTHEGTLTAAFVGNTTLREIVQPTPIANLSFVASSEGLEELGRQMTDVEGYYTAFASMLSTIAEDYDFAILDSPNQISPIMESAIWATDLFIVPFESTKSVRSYANVYKLIYRLRGEEEVPILHVLSNLSRQVGLHNRVVGLMAEHGIAPAAAEIRTCGWLAQVDEHGGSIFHYRPHSKGAEDMSRLLLEVCRTLGVDVSSMPVIDMDADHLLRTPVVAPVEAIADYSSSNNHHDQTA